MSESVSTAASSALNCAIRLLSMAQPFSPEPKKDLKEAQTKTAEAATHLRALTKITGAIISSTVRGNTSYDQAKDLIELMRGTSDSQPSILLSKCVIQWVLKALLDMDYLKKGSSSFLQLLPVFFQLLLTAAELHPALHADVMYVLAIILNTGSDNLIPQSVGGEMAEGGRVKITQENVAGTYTGIKAHEDALRVMVRIMGLGFSLVPLNYLTAKVSSFDAALVRHTIILLVESVVGVSRGDIKAAHSLHLSRAFAAGLKDFFATASVKSALQSTHLGPDAKDASNALKSRALTVLAEDKNAMEVEDGDEDLF